MYSDMVFKVLSQNFCQGWSVTEFEILCRDIRAFRHKVVNIILPVCTSKLFTRKFHILNHLIEIFSIFGVYLR